MARELPTLFDLLILLIVFSLVFFIFLGFLFNKVFLFVFIFCRKLKNSTNIYLFNLAIVHELFILGWISLLVSAFFKGRWPLHEINVHCKVYYVVLHLYKVTGSWFLLAVISDRFYFQKNDYSNDLKWRRRKVAFILSLGIWLVSVASILPFLPFVLSSEQQPVPGPVSKPSCYFWSDVDSVKIGGIGDGLYEAYSFILAFALPIGPIFYFYFDMRRQLKVRDEVELREAINLLYHAVEAQQLRIEEANRIQRITGQQADREHLVSRLVLNILKIYFIFWIPFWIVAVIGMFLSTEVYESTTFNPMKLLTRLFIIFYAAVNPLMMMKLCNQGIRWLRKICFCCYCLLIPLEE